MNERKERHGCVGAWLWLAIVANLGCGIFYATTMFGADTDYMSIGLGVLAILAILNVLGSILLMRWNKTGFYIFVLGSILGSIVNVVILEIAPYYFISSLLAILVWWGILQIKKNDTSAWKLLETGWDYKHCRHLYQLFGIIIGVLLILTIMAYNGNHDGNAYDGIMPYNEELPVDTIATEDETEWQLFSDQNNMCSIEAPNNFYETQLNEDQILGLMCTDYDPAVLVFSETASSVKDIGVKNTKEYANILVNLNRNADGTSGFHKISEEVYGGSSYLIVYNITINGARFRWSILASKTKSNFYSCQIYCLEEYAENLQPTISHMFSSFKTLK